MTLAPEQPDIPRRGDVRLVRPHLDQEVEARLALVVRGSDDGFGFVQIMLAHERPEMAGTDDVVLQPDSSRLSKGLVVQTIVRGGIWPSQCSELVVRLTHDDMNEVSQMVSASLPTSREASEQLPEPELSHEQAALRESEFESLQDLIADCLDAVLDDGEPWRIDPALYSSTLLECHEQPSILLASLSHVLHTREVAATLDDTKALHARDSLASSEWDCTQYGEDLVAKIVSSVNALAASVLTDSAGGNSSGSEPSLTCEAPQRLPTATPLTLRAGTRLITAPHLWTDHGDQLIQLAERGCLAEVGLSDSSHACKGDCFVLEIMMLTYDHNCETAPSCP